MTVIPTRLSMIILGIDPGIADTGYGIVEKKGDVYVMVECGSITTPASEAMPKRLAMLAKELACLIARNRPEVVAVEEIFFAKNTKTAMAVAQARGVVLATAEQNNCRVREFTPLEVKQALTGYGRADKRQIQSMVKTILGLHAIPKPDDAADALAVAVCAGQTKEFDV